MEELGSRSSDVASNSGWSSEADSVRISSRDPVCLDGDQGTKGARVITGVPKPRTFSGLASSWGG